tara:strand:- start:1191 stop:1574 length:384 start_codon:yes stop_codon:yes gene_type:complete
MPKLMTLLEVLVLFYLVLCMIIGAVVGVVATLSGIFVLDLMLGLVLGCGLGWLSLAACGFIAFVLERAKGIAERRAIRRRFEARAPRSVSIVAPQRSSQKLRLVTLAHIALKAKNPTDSPKTAFCGV